MIEEEGRHRKCQRKHRLALADAKLADVVHEPLPITTHVTVTIPIGPLTLQSFSSIFGGLSQSALSPVFDDVTFESISIISGHGKLAISNLKAARATIATDNKPIAGTFTVTEKLSLLTSNAPIDANVTLINNATLNRPTFLEIITKNASVTTIADLVLASSSSDILDEDVKNGSFRVGAFTSSAPVNVTIGSQPVSSILTLSAVTDHGDVNVALPPAYEGKFTLVTRNGGESSVIKNDAALDPGGKGRRRFVDVKKPFGGIATGIVKWVDANADDDLVKEEMEWEAELLDVLGPEAEWGPQSHVELITVAANNTLFLT